MVLTHCASSTLGCVYISSGSGQLGPGFCLTEGPQGVGGGRAEGDASPGTSVTVEENENSAASPRRRLPRLAPGAGRVKVEPAFSALFAAKALEPCASSSCLFPHLRPERQPRASGWGRWQVTGWEALLSRGRWAVGISPCS